jgi:hypothetical protein
VTVDSGGHVLGGGDHVDDELEDGGGEDVDIEDVVEEDRDE